MAASALTSETLPAHGDPDDPLPDDALTAKARLLAEPVLGSGRVARIIDACEALPDGAAYRELMDDLLAPV